MDNIFIGWSGNQSLAIELGNEINRSTNYKAIVGGGTPTKMFIGDQVLQQIKESDYAILLMEKKDGAISQNLMFELGYIFAKMTVNRVFLVLINIETSELASDISGAWIFKSKHFDRSVTSESAFAQELCKDFYEFQLKNGSAEESNYFNVINRWEECFADLKEDRRISKNDADYILFGCLAAYYYNDYKELRRFLDDVSCDEAVSDLVYFAKFYISIFLDSGNMMYPLDDDQILTLREAFEDLLERERKLSQKLDAFLDILIHDAYGLACVLYLRNEDIDEEEREYFSHLCETHLLNVFSLLGEYKEQYGDDNKYIVNLFNAYICNDLAKFYRDMPEPDEEKHLEYLNRSVLERKSLFKSVQILYPNNKFLVEKMEQEYLIALSDQCKYEKDNVLKKITVKKIKKRLDEWVSNYKSLRSMVERIEVNLKEIDV